MANFTVRTNTRNNGGIDTRYGKSRGHWSVEFEKNGANQHILVGWESTRSVRQILADDHGVDINDGTVTVQFLQG